MPRPETQRYLSTAYRHLKEHGKWPTAREMERAMQDDYLKAARALRSRFGPWFPVEDWNAQVRLTLPALRRTPIVLEDLEVFRRALPIVAEAYRNARSHPVLSSERLLQSGFSPEDLRAVWRVMEIESSLSDGSRYTGPAEWEFTLSAIIPKVVHARSVEELLDLVAKPERKWARRVREWYSKVSTRGRTLARTKAAKALGGLLIAVLGGLLATWIWFEFFA